MRNNPVVTMEDVVPGWTLRKDVSYREYEAAAKASYDTLSAAQVPELRVFAALLSSVGVPDDQLYTVVRLAYEGATLRSRVEKRIEEHREEMQVQVGRILAGAGSDESREASLERYRKLASSWSQILERELETTVTEGIRKMSEGASGLNLGAATTCSSSTFAVRPSRSPGFELRERRPILPPAAARE